MSRVLFISDPHFGHKNIIKYCNRPFLDTEEMDNVIIENYNRTVQDDDLVFWLGDMFFCGSQRMDYIASRLRKGRKILIRGNHDKGVTDGKFMKLGFMPHRMYKLGHLLLTHEPISQDNMNILQDYRMKNLHGHTHNEDTGLDPTKYQCVSAELINYTPILFSNVLDRYNDGEAWRKWAEKQQNKGDLK
jgi:calcineurin-like phosphoesterase family protein